MAHDLPSLAEDILTAARQAGADAADALVSQATSVNITIQSRKLEQAERSEGVDLGLRVMVGQRQACVSVSDTNASTIQMMAERAVAMAKDAPEDATIGLAEPGQLAQSWDLAALDLAEAGAEIDPAQLEQDARAAEDAAFAVEGISQVESAGASFSQRAMHLAATNGFSGGYSKTDHSLYCVAITGSGTEMERDYFGDSRTYRSALLSAEEIGTTAAERTLARAGARKPPTGTFPVFYDERVSSSLMMHLLSAINGAAIARGSSWLRDALESQVLPESLSLIEDPHRPQIAGSRPFDAEGLPTQKRAIIDKGVLTSWTLDLGTGRKLGMASTANAVRSASAPPHPSVGNVELTGPNHARDDLLAQMGTGLLVTSLMGSTINPTTGDYSRGAAGLWVENGVPQYPVNECTIAGNLRDMLMRIIPADDARGHLSRVVPSILIEDMIIAGA